MRHPARAIFKTILAVCLLPFITGIDIPDADAAPRARGQTARTATTARQEPRTRQRQATRTHRQVPARSATVQHTPAVPVPAPAHSTSVLRPVTLPPPTPLTAATPPQQPRIPMAAPRAPAAALTAAAQPAAQPRSLALPPPAAQTVTTPRQPLRIPPAAQPRTSRTPPAAPAAAAPAVASATPRLSLSTPQGPGIAPMPDVNITEPYPRTYRETKISPTILNAPSGYRGESFRSSERPDAPDDELFAPMPGVNVRIPFTR